MAETDIFIVGAKRTAIGSLGGSLSDVPAHMLGATAIKAALAQAGMDGARVDDVLMGQVLTAGARMNPARQAARTAGLPDATPAAIINQVCGSGLRSVALAYHQMLAGAASVCVAGGQESMSQAPHVAYLRKGKKFGDVELRDTVMSEGLSDAFYGYPMGVTAENVVRQYGISRDDQDAFAELSHARATAAQRAGYFEDEIASVEVKSRKGGVTVEVDEHIRPDTTLETLSKLKPAFETDGTVTAGNASGINDGAAALVLADAEAVTAHGLTPLLRIVSTATTGLDPQVMGLGPISASHKALELAGWDAHAVDLWELNEAFAAQSIAVVRDLDLDMERVNVSGGAIALGHPIGASGARILVTLAHNMQRRQAQRGVAALCIGGGMGIAICVERV